MRSRDKGLKSFQMNYKILVNVYIEQKNFLYFATNENSRKFLIVYNLYRPLVKNSEKYNFLFGFV